MLCPPLWCSKGGVLLIMKRARPLAEREFRELMSRGKLPYFEWDYGGPGDDGCPFEPKADAWGWLDGKVVAIDYSASVAALVD